MRGERSFFGAPKSLSLRSQLVELDRLVSSTLTSPASASSRLRLDDHFRRRRGSPASTAQLQHEPQSKKVSGWRPRRYGSVWSSDARPADAPAPSSDLTSFLVYSSSSSNADPTLQLTAIALSTLTRHFPPPLGKRPRARHSALRPVPVPIWVPFRCRGVRKASDRWEKRRGGGGER